MFKIYAVITGDLIGSRTQADATEASMRVLSETCKAWGALYALDLRFTRHRGDGWQVIVPAKYFFDLSISLAACLRAHENALLTKIAIGLGTVTSVGTADLSDGRGDAFVASGSVLDFLKEHSATNQMFIAGPASHPLYQGVLRMTDWMVKGWTQPQAEAVLIYMLRKDLDTNAERAQVLGISRQAYESRFKSSGFPELIDVRDAFMNSEFKAST